MSEDKDPISGLLDVILEVFGDELGEIPDENTEAEAKSIVDSEFGGTSLNPSTGKPYLMKATYDELVGRLCVRIRNAQSEARMKAMKDRGFGEW